jgi:hypothetical protein
VKIYATLVLLNLMLLISNANCHWIIRLVGAIDVQETSLTINPYNLGMIG